jgi:hypothetical protein
MALPKQAVNLGLLVLASSDTDNNRVEYQVVVQDKDIEMSAEFFYW